MNNRAMTMLKAQNIYVSASTTPILKGVSASLVKGQMVGLIGPNGAGKSTLLRTISGLIKPEQGEVHLEDQNIQDIPPKSRAKQIAYAAQGAPVHWPLTVEHMVSLGRIPHLDPWQKISDEDQQIINQVMTRTDCAHLKDRIVTTLSGGERACAMLARTLATGAPYILADEPVASLDPYHQLQIMDILKQLATQDHGVLIVLHDLTLAQRYCDHLILMNDGLVLAEGKASDVLTSNNLQQAYHIQAAQWQENGDHFLVPWKRTPKNEQ